MNDSAAGGSRECAQVQKNEVILEIVCENPCEIARDDNDSPRLMKTFGGCSDTPAIEGVFQRLQIFQINIERIGNVARNARSARSPTHRVRRCSERKRQIMKVVLKFAKAG